MIIDRRIFPVKFGKMDEVVQILATGGDIVPDRPKARILTSFVGTFDRVVLELEFENLAGYEAWWTAWAQAPGQSEVMERFWACVEPGGVQEIWEVAETLE